ncbi:hypothetical protein HJC23_003347 [Cyclotella cryptica]|uniref:Fe2OG dioxygenase domain-containing protein n=1 Tax=Cyclotella cryptica TaxID=29204 RepID=A0ABD3QXF0_9STRA|eukprot:CCRYP_000910-RA/>CCRYP_000910-RA protein AED:0.12 eAED:0.12 QI:0/-1/0/1/-1/1/1/0/453
MLVESSFHSTWRGGATPPTIHRPNVARFSHSPLHAAISISTTTSTPNHHVITIPPFLDHDDSNTNGRHYPSPLHKIHILPLLTPEETSHLLHLAQTHAAATSSWDRQDTTRHINYNTVDFAVDDSEEMVRYLGDDDNGGIGFHTRMFHALSEAFDVDVEDLSYLDLFCASYQGRGEIEEEGGDDESSIVDSKRDEQTNEVDNDGERKTMDRLEFHRDGSLLSFTLLLNPPNEFQGGGTIFDALRSTNHHHNHDTDHPSSTLLTAEGCIRPPHAGYATLHCGKLLHGGHIVTGGQRIVLVGFVDVDERNIKDGALGNAAREWGRNDVRLFWERRRVDLWKRQSLEQQQCEEEDKDGRTSPRRHPRWVLRNEKFLPSVGRSCLKSGIVIPSPILDRMEARANDERIRQRRLKTEDALLREILLPRELRGDKILEGEWREVEYDENGVPIGIEIVD